VCRRERDADGLNREAPNETRCSTVELPAHALGEEGGMGHEPITFGLVMLAATLQPPELAFPFRAGC
jgi:hypothetical protein